MKLVTLYDYVRMTTLHAWMPFLGESQGRGVGSETQSGAWCMVGPQKRYCKGRGEKGGVSAGTYTTIWLLKVTLSPPAAVSKQDF